MSEKDGGPALTEWYPADVKPVRKGVYEVQAKIAPIWYRRRDGHDWFNGKNNPIKAANSYNTTNVRDPWRGLKERAK